MRTSGLHAGTMKSTWMMMRSHGGVTIPMALCVQARPVPPKADLYVLMVVRVHHARKNHPALMQHVPLIGLTHALPQGGRQCARGSRQAGGKS